MPKDRKNSDLSQCLDHYVGGICSGIAFGGMSDCGEEYLEDKFAGYHEITWGIIFHFRTRSQLVLTWDDDENIGDPFFVNHVDFEKFKKIDSLEIQDVSMLQPWDQYIATVLNRFTVLTYETNYPGESETHRHEVPWAIELEFEKGPILIGSMHHGDFLENKICADEIVVVQNPTIIGKTKEARVSVQGGWKQIIP